LIVVFAAVALIFVAVVSVSAQHAPGEPEAKARFLANTPTFVEWPPNVFPTPSTPLLICIHGDFSFGTALAELTRGETVKGRKLEVRWIHSDQSLAGCQVLFVTRSMAKKYAKVLETVKDSGALTIGEDPEFLRAGGMVNLEPVASSLTFDVNIDAVSSSHLKMSSQLLSLARHVFHTTQVAKG
jgi:hypothetical protein